MEKKYFGRNIIRQIMEGRAARTIAVTVSVFLCVLTLFEFTALQLEWEIPALAVISGEHSIWSEEYQQEELALDDSKENEILPPGETPEGATSDETIDNDEAIEDGAESAERIADEGSINGDATEDNEEVADTEMAEETEFPYYIKINRQQNCITIYTQDENGEYTVPYKAMICSTGLYNATPRGIYQISTKYLWRELYGGVYGQYATRIHGGVLFHSVPYYSKSKDSLCADKYNKLGQQASMGCVRLTVEDAKWIAENCPEGTTVEIYDDDDPGPLGKPEAVKIDTDSPIKGWDPTDPDVNNPWHDVSLDE